jgi:hypothetical protein
LIACIGLELKNVQAAIEEKFTRVIAKVGL